MTTDECRSRARKRYDHAGVPVLTPRRRGTTRCCAFNHQRHNRMELGTSELRPLTRCRRVTCRRVSTSRGVDGAAVCSGRSRRRLLVGEGRRLRLTRPASGRVLKFERAAPLNDGRHEHLDAVIL